LLRSERQNSEFESGLWPSRGIRMKNAFEHITVLDFSQLLAGPYAAMMLGDMGADVIKIERLGTGDLYRGMTFGNQFIGGDVSPPFLAWNRNKRSIALDLKDPEVKEVIYKMAKTSDVVIHNFRPGVMEKLGFAYEDFKKINPGIVYGSNSGYGPEGPYADRPGQDLLAQGLSGIMSLTGRRGSHPTPFGTGVADHLSAYHLVYGILSALVYRNETGQGQEVEVDLFRSMLAFENQEFATVLNTDIPVEKPDSGIGLPFLEAPYGVYQCQDGYMTIAMNNFEKLVMTMGLPELLRYDTDRIRYEMRDEIFHALEAVTKTNTVDYWLDKLLAVDLWVNKVNHIRDVEKDPQVQAMGTIQSYEHPVAGDFKVIGPAVTMGRTQPTIDKVPPLVGQHSREILENFGIRDEEIRKLESKGVLEQYG